MDQPVFGEVAGISLLPNALDRNMKRSLASFCLSALLNRLTSEPRQRLKVKVISQGQRSNAVGLISIID